MQNIIEIRSNLCTELAPPDGVQTVFFSFFFFFFLLPREGFKSHPLNKKMTDAKDDC